MTGVVPTPTPTLTLLQVLRRLCCQDEACSCRDTARQGVGRTHCPLCAKRPNTSLQSRVTPTKLILECLPGCSGGGVVDYALKQIHLPPPLPPAPEPEPKFVRVSRAPATEAPPLVSEPRFIRVQRASKQRGARAARIALQVPPKPTVERWTPLLTGERAVCQATIRGEDWVEDELAGFINARRQAPM